MIQYIAQLVIMVQSNNISTATTIIHSTNITKSELMLVVSV
jgi:hypothetical protein